MTEELSELEPIQDAPAADAAAPSPAAQPNPGGMRNAGVLGAPAFNPSADREYYRFLFAGVIMFLGCMMPWGPDWTMAGYQTLSGSLFTLISVGMIWSWWSAIASGRFGGANLKWVGLSLIPFIAMLNSLINAFDAAAVKDFADAGKAMPDGWGGFFGDLVDSLPIAGGDEVAGAKVSNFLRAFGAGQIVLFFGSLYAEIAFLQAVMGGAKHAKQQKAAAAAGGRRRRS